MKTYLRVLRAKGVARITAAQLGARLPWGMIELALLIHVSARTGSYAQAGLVLGVFSIAQAVSGPVAARLLGIWGVRPMLVGTTIVCAATLLGISFLPASVLLLCLLAAVAGLTVPPVMPAVRALYPRLVSPELLHPLFVLDTSSQEVLWVIGPTFTAVLASAISSSTPLVVASAVILGGGAWLISAPALNGFRIGRSPARFGRTLLSRPVLVGVVASLLLVATFSAMQVGVLVRVGRDNPLSGLVLGSGALGSLLGGLALGRRVSGRRSLIALTTWVLVCTVLAAVAPEDLTLTCAVFFAGVGFAPAVAALYSAVSTDVDARDVAEAFGWLSSGMLVGGAMGTAVAGAATDAMGALGAFLTTIGFASAGPIAVIAPGALRAAAGRRRDATP
ncbi:MULTISPECIES: MFS transporter [unclassified Microbacterium]|uniref:MFS transporter n=1 Tax=unclassified Microbacterium TaxID=2609290 RepID=UPI0030185F7D